MRTDLFDFELPVERIALRPIAPRDAARLLVVRPATDPRLEDCTVRDLPDLLRTGDALVINNTRVIPARLSGRRIWRPATWCGSATRARFASSVSSMRRWSKRARAAK